MDLNAGASSNPPALRMATPLAAPLVRSLNLDCSQVRVPSPAAGETKSSSRNRVIFVDSRRKFVTEYSVLAEELRVSRAGEYQVRVSEGSKGRTDQSSSS